MIQQSKQRVGAYRGGLMVLTATLLSACSVHRMAEHALGEIDRSEQLHVEDAIHQVRMAMVATQAYYLHRDRRHDTGLVLDTVEATINANHIDTGTGNFALVVAGGGQEQATATTSLKLTLSAIDIPDIDVWPPTDDAKEIQSAIVRFREESELACARSPKPAEVANVTERNLWESIALVAIAGLDSYLCAAEHGGGVRMTGYETTVSIRTEISEDEGVTFRLWGWRLGDTATEDSDDAILVVLKFRKPQSQSKGPA